MPAKRRRDVLRGIGITGALALAGCVGDDGDDGDDGGSDGDDGGSDGDDGGSDGDDGGSDGDDGGDIEDREVMYGVLMPETGDLGSLGPAIRDGALLVETQLQDEFDWLSFDVSTGDTQTDPQAGISTANSLVDSGYPAVVGSASSNVNLQITRESFIPNEVVGISPASTAQEVTELDDNDYIFRTAPSDDLQGQVQAQIAAEELDASSVSTLFLNDNYGQGLEEVFATSFEENQDGEVLERVSFEPQQASYSSVVGEAMGAEPDLLWIVGFPQSGIQMFRDYYAEHSEDTPIMVPDGLIDDNLPSEVGNDMENVYGTAPGAAGEGLETFNNLYEEEWGEPPAVFNSHAYDAAAVVVLANLAAGENDGTGVRDNMREVANPGGTEVNADNLAEGCEMAAQGEEIQYIGASSDVDFDDNGDPTSAAYEFYRVQDGAFEVQDTIETE